MRSVMQHRFSQIEAPSIQRSTFDRTHGYKTTFDAGKLIPFYLDEILPGDTFKVSVTAFARLATPLVPIMDNMKMSFFFFFCPNRLVWNNFVKQMGEQVDPGDSIDYLTPQVVLTNVSRGTVPDYFGLPIEKSNGYSVSALPFRVYNLVYNEWFRDENLQDSLVVDKDDGPDTAGDYITLRNRGKRKDYFTSALPWPQKGDAISLPLGTTAPVMGIGKLNNSWFNVNTQYYETDKGLVNYVNAVGIDPGTATGTFVVRGPDGGTSGNPQIYADLSEATAATINSVREAFQLQRMLERDARSGTRYTSVIKGHYGVISPDARLQRPELLGMGSTNVVVNPVAQTAPGTFTGDPETPVGNLAGFGTAGAGGIGFSQSFTEHGFVIGLLCVDADLTYSQGIDRFWSRQTRYDYYWPSLAHLGEQEILNQEIYFDNATLANNSLIFGYQERYAEYRYKNSKVTGLFRTDITNNLDIWHLSEEFTSLPALNASFIESAPPVDRVIAVPSEPHFIFDSYISAKCTRPMPIFSTPGLIDHF